MTAPKEVFIEIDVAKLRNAVAIADAGRDGEIRYMGEFGASPESMTRLVRKVQRGAGTFVELLSLVAAAETPVAMRRPIGPLGHPLESHLTQSTPSVLSIRTDALTGSAPSAQSLARKLT